MIYRFGDCELDDRRYELRRGGVACHHLGLLGEALATSGHPEEGLAVVEEAIRTAGTARPFYYQPELHRLRGDLLARGPRQTGQAAQAYGRAVELATAEALLELGHQTSPQEV